MENIFILHDERMETAVRIVIGQLQQLRFRKGGHRVVGQRVGGMGVDIGVVGLEGKVEPQAGAGIFFRACQRRVFKYMRYAGIIFRPGGEGQLEDAVGILVRDIQHFRAGLLMLKKHQLGAEQREGTDLLHFEAFHHVAHGGQRNGFRGRFGEGGNQAGQQSQRKNQGKQLFHIFPPRTACCGIYHILPRSGLFLKGGKHKKTPWGSAGGAGIKKSAPRRGSAMEKQEFIPSRDQGSARPARPARRRPAEPAGTPRCLPACRRSARGRRNGRG